MVAPFAMLSRRCHHYRRRSAPELIGHLRAAPVGERSAWLPPKAAIPDIHSIVYSGASSGSPVVVRGARNNNGMSVALADPVDVMSGCLHTLRRMLSSLDDKQIVQALRGIETHLRQTHSVMLELVAEAESRRIAAQRGFGNTARLLAGMLQLSAAPGRPRGEHAPRVGTPPTPPRQTPPPRLPL